MVEATTLLAEDEQKEAESVRCPRCDQRTIYFDKRWNVWMCSIPHPVCGWFCSIRPDPKLYA